MYASLQTHHFLSLNVVVTLDLDPPRKESSRPHSPIQLLDTTPYTKLKGWQAC